MSFSQKRSRSAHSSGLSDASTNKPPSDENSKPPLFHKRLARNKAKTPTNEKPKQLAKTSMVVRSTDNIRAKIANRKQSTSDEITPELAAKVVKAFILPMFQNDSRNVQAKNRAAAFGLDKVVGGVEGDSGIRSPPLNPLNMSDGTVLSELKLSEQLLGQINELQDDLRVAQYMTKDSQQHRESLELEQCAMRDKLLLANSSVEFFKHQYEQLQTQVQKSEFTASLLNTEVNDLKKLAKDLKTERGKLVEQLNEEKSNSDKLRNRVVELEHTNHLLKMGSDIMSDHLKGLYEAVEGLVTRRGLEETLSVEYRNLNFMASEFKSHADKLEEKLNGTIAERDVFSTDCRTMSELRSELKSQMEKFSLSAKERINTLSAHNKDLLTEQERLNGELAKMTKNYKDLLSEHDKFRQKVKTLSKQTGNAETVMCRNCQKLYTDNDNFNWSCKIHLSEYNGEMWWCCGKSGISAPGCKAGKHLPKSDEYEEEQKIEKVSIRCSSCREVGHHPKDCPKDPNIRSNGAIPDEMQRINMLRQKRQYRYVTRAEVDSNFNGGSEKYDESEMSAREEDLEEAFTDIDKVKEALSIKTDIASLTEETLERNASFKPPLSNSISRKRIKRSQVSPKVPMLLGLPGSFESKETNTSRRSSGVLPSTELSDYQSSVRGTKAYV